jgi:hypothetical protein
MGETGLADCSTISRSLVKARKARAQDTGNCIVLSPRRGDRKCQEVGKIGGQGQSSYRVCLQAGLYNLSVLPALKTQLKKSAFCSIPKTSPFAYIQSFLNGYY